MIAEQAVEHFLSSLLNKDLAKFQMTDWKWAVLQDFEMILAVCSGNPAP
jgi:hypothetical protein